MVALIQQPLDNTADLFALAFQHVFSLILLSFIQQINLNRTKIVFFIGFQMVFFFIIELGHLVSHAIHKNLIDAIYDITACPIVISEIQPPAFSILSVLICPSFFIKQFRFRVTESIDTLLYITHHKDRMAITPE